MHSSQTCLGEGVEAIADSSPGCWERYSTNTLADGSPPQRTPWTATGIAAPPWPWCLHSIQLYVVSTFLKGATKSHGVKSGCMTDSPTHYITNIYHYITNFSQNSTAVLCNELYQGPWMPASVVHFTYSALEVLAIKLVKLSPFVLMHQFCHAAHFIQSTELTVDCSHMITCNQPLFASSPANVFHLYSPHSCAQVIMMSLVFVTAFT